MPPGKPVADWCTHGDCNPVTFAKQGCFLHMTVRQRPHLEHLHGLGHLPELQVHPPHLHPAQKAGKRAG